MEMDLIILQEAERESMDIFHAMREELLFCLKRIRLLEVVLTDNGIPVPDYEDRSLALLVPLGWQSLLLAESSGEVAENLRQGGGFSPCTWRLRSGICMRTV